METGSGFGNSCSLRVAILTNNGITIIFQDLAHDRKVLDLQGIIRKEVSIQTDNQEENIRDQRARTLSHSAPQAVTLSPILSVPAVGQHLVKVAAFQMINHHKVPDTAGPPKWKRQLMAKSNP
jgi:hypothetical protein